MMESDIANSWVMGTLVLVVISAWISAGGFMLYSAITGKGITKPERDEPGGIWVQYHLRGIIGLGFIVSGLYMFYEAFNFIF